MRGTSILTTHPQTLGALKQSPYGVPERARCAR